MKKSTILILSICIWVSFMFPLQYQAKLRTGHDSITKQIVLNGRHGNSFSPEEKKVWKMLTSAMYLAVDQFNGEGNNDLMFLKENKVKDLPSDISEIDVQGNANKNSSDYHRKFTHIGWNDKRYITKNQLEFWKKRRSIIINTVDKIFDFENSIYSLTKNTKQKDAFCELLYYCHIIGDHLDDKSFEHNLLKIEIGGRTDKIDIINELLLMFPNLFPNQKHTQEYISLIRELTDLNIEVRMFYKNCNGNITDDLFPEYKNFTNQLHKILKSYVPGLLKEEPFFRDVFY